MTFIMSVQLSESLKNDEQQQEKNNLSLEFYCSVMRVGADCQRPQRDFRLSSEVISSLLLHCLSAYLTHDYSLCSHITSVKSSLDEYAT